VGEPAHALLADALDGGAVRTGSDVTGLAERAQQVHVEGPTSDIAADAVVVADGVRSRLRAALFPAHPGIECSGEFAARATAPGLPVGVTPAPGELLDHRTGDRVGRMPMADGRVYWYATWRGDRAVAPAEPAALLGWLRARRTDWHPCVAALLSTTPAGEVHVAETTRLVRPLPALAVGRIALLGDAAHVMTPDLGQGACQAFEDAAILAAALEHATTVEVPRALAGYDARRRPRTGALMRQARRTNRLLTLRGPLGRTRDVGMRLIPTALATRALAAQFRIDPGGARASARR
jgi:2-polyprenyl-6-methoxyphenol hydroxylase-like FAD-dependent oxidoreductase